jgi:hypothetical protein
MPTIGTAATGPRGRVASPPTDLGAGALGQRRRQHGLPHWLPFTSVSSTYAHRKTGRYPAHAWRNHASGPLCHISDSPVDQRRSDHPAN